MIAAGEGWSSAGSLSSPVFVLHHNGGQGGAAYPVKGSGAGGPMGRCGHILSIGRTQRMGG